MENTRRPSLAANTKRPALGAGLAYIVLYTLKTEQSGEIREGNEETRDKQMISDEIKEVKPSTY